MTKRDNLVTSKTLEQRKEQLSDEEKERLDRALEVSNAMDELQSGSAMREHQADADGDRLEMDFGDEEYVEFDPKKPEPNEIDYRDIPRVIAVDFDGTLVENKWPEIGEIKENIVEEVRKEKEQGSIIILWTCRTGELLQKAIKFCYDNDIPIDYANEDCRWIKENFGDNGVKVFATQYWDDKGVNVNDIGEED